MDVDVSPFREVAGSALRAVASYDRDGLVLAYERSDIAEKERVVDKIHEELVLSDIGRDWLEQLFGVGRWHCTMHRFEEAICVHYAAGELSGYFVSVDTDADVDLADLARLCDDL